LSNLLLIGGKKRAHGKKRGKKGPPPSPWEEGKKKKTNGEEKKEKKEDRNPLWKAQKKFSGRAFFKKGGGVSFSGKKKGEAPSMRAGKKENEREEGGIRPAGKKGDASQKCQLARKSVQPRGKAWERKKEVYRAGGKGGGSNKKRKGGPRGEKRERILLKERQERRKSPVGLADFEGKKRPGRLEIKEKAEEKKRGRPFCPAYCSCREKGERPERKKKGGGGNGW